MIWWLAQTTEPAITPESTIWVGGLPLHLMIYSSLGAFLSILVFFYRRMDVAANSKFDPNTESLASVVFLAIVTGGIGWIVGFGGTPYAVELLSIQSQNATDALTIGLAAGGVPVALYVPPMIADLIRNLFASRINNP